MYIAIIIIAVYTISMCIIAKRSDERIARMKRKHGVVDTLLGDGIVSDR